MALSDSDRNAILQTAIIRCEEGERGAPESFTPEEKEYYEGLEAEILEDMENGIEPDYSISCDYDW